MSIDTTLKITEIQRFCMHDGPGVRTTVFLKGCPLRCAWCHNPETQKGGAELLFYPNKCIGCEICAAVCPVGAHRFEKTHTVDRERCIGCLACAGGCPAGALEQCGRDMTVEEILSVVEKDRAFYGDAGGVTLSGGEPFAQKETVELLKACRERGISTAVETCGYADASVLLEAAPCVDLFLWDLKDTDPERHLANTGASNRLILQNLRLINEKRARIRLRCILVSGVNTMASHYKNVAEIAHTLDNLEGVELIPYHAYGGAKATFLGENDSGRREWIPTEAQIEEARAILTDCGVRVIG